MPDAEPHRRTVMIRTRIRPAVQAAAGIAAVVALAAGCGSGTDEGQEVPVGEPGIEQDEQDASDQGGAAGEEGAADEDGAADEREGAGASAPPGWSEAGDAAPASSARAAEATTDTVDALRGDAGPATATLPATAEDAWDIALEATGGGEVRSIEIDDHDGSWELEIEIQLDGEEHELDIDATTGEVTDHDREADDDREPAVDITSPMTYQEAIEIALGEQDGRVEGWELDSDDGRIEYTIDIEREDVEDVEVEVDVETGETRIDD